MMNLNSAVELQTAHNLRRTKLFIETMILAISNGQQSIIFEDKTIYIFYRKTDYVDGLDNYFIEFLLDVRLYKRVFNTTFIKNEFDKIYHNSLVNFTDDSLTIKVY